MPKEESFDERVKGWTWDEVYLNLRHPSVQGDQLGQAQFYVKAHFEMLEQQRRLRNSTIWVVFATWVLAAATIVLAVATW